MELQGTAGEPEPVLSDEDLPSDRKEQEIDNDSSTFLSTDEEEEMLKKIRKQTYDKAKAIMWYDADKWRQHVRVLHQQSRVKDNYLFFKYLLLQSE